MLINCPRCIGGQVLGDSSWASCLHCGYVHTDNGHRFTAGLVSTLYRRRDINNDSVYVGDSTPKTPNINIKNKKLQHTLIHSTPTTPKYSSKSVKIVPMSQSERESWQKLKDYYSSLR